MSCCSCLVVGGGAIRHHAIKDQLIAPFAVGFLQTSRQVLAEAVYENLSLSLSFSVFLCFSACLSAYLNLGPGTIYSNEPIS